MQKEGLRYNSGKLRYDLLPQNALKEVVDVYTKGAHKYSIYQDEEGREIKGSDISFEEAVKYKKIYDGGNNWRLGLPWMETMAAVERHQNKWKSGTDFDEELGTYHLANAIWGQLALLEFYKTHPEKDNRIMPYFQEKRIGIDIDDVLADFIGGYCTKYERELPTSWNFDPKFEERYAEILKNPTFYKELKTIISPKELPFDPVCYITSREESTRKVTEEWLFEINSYPLAPVFFVKDKLKTCLDNKLNVFIDDKYETFKHLNQNGMLCYLFDSSHNQKWNVGYKRLTKNNLKTFL